ncbi:MAG: polysaccharide biosynthesis tyrosine autokinase [Deltaproteobacteria bacterium]|nr:polysaccharide biosynthesis tyrosine autokinase [Deltaproteobacteria bacterium]
MEQEQYSRDFSLHDYFHVIEKRYSTVVFTIFFIVGIVAVFNWQQAPTYMTSGKVMIERSGDLAGSFNIMQSLMLSLNNYIEIIKSRKFLAQVVDKLKEEGVNNVTVPYLRGNIKIKPVSGTDLLEISGYGSEPESLRKTVDAIIDLFVVDSSRVQEQTSDSRLKYLENQLGTIESQLREAEQEFRDFQKKERIFSNSSSQTGAGNNIVSWEIEKKELEFNIEMNAKLLEILESDLAKYVSNTAGAESNGHSGVIKLEDSLENIEAEYARAKLVYKSRHPKRVELEKRLKKIQAEFEAMKNGSFSAVSSDPVLNELKAQILKKRLDIYNDKTRLKILESMINDEKVDETELSDKNLKYIRLERKVKVTEKIYSMILQKFNESQIQASSVKQKIHIVDYSRDCGPPIRPNKMLNLFLAFIVSIITGMGFAFLREHLDKSIKTSEEARLILEKPIIGLIPEIKKSEIKESMQIMENSKVYLDPSIITFTETNTLSSESFRTLRTNILFSKGNESIKSLLVTNPQENAGKSTIASNLAVSFAQIDKRVLLVDTDLRKPILHKLFNLDNSVGLTNALLGGSLEDCISRTPLDNLHVLTSGPVPPNPSELLGASRMEEIIKILENQYDLVIFDSPPVIAVTDAAVIASKVSGTLYSVCLHRLARKQAQKGMELLTNVNANVVGIICNYVKDRELGGYYYRYGYV